MVSLTYDVDIELQTHKSFKGHHQNTSIARPGSFSSVSNKGFQLQQKYEDFYIFKKLSIQIIIKDFQLDIREFLANQKNVRHKKTEVSIKFCTVNGLKFR